MSVFVTFVRTVWTVTLAIPVFGHGYAGDPVFTLIRQLITGAVACGIAVATAKTCKGHVVKLACN